jgi:hypothetical protein
MIGSTMTSGFSGAWAWPRRRGADAVDGFGRDLDLFGRGEVAGEDGVAIAEEAVALDPLQHAAHCLGRDSSSARWTPAGMAAQQRGGHQHRIHFKRRKHEGGYAAPDTGASHIRRDHDD